MKLCECGCGSPAPIAKRTDSAKGWKKGQPLRYLLGHNPTPHRNRRREPTAPRFWAKVSQSDGCWQWTGATTSWGYGVLRVKGHNVHAHRVSWELHNGPIPEEMFVCHKCDNPQCTNPEHLFIGTARDNALDMIAKKRHGTKKY